MSFLNPIMLAGLAAIAVPIIIHLLNRRRFQKVVWAAMRFLQAAVEQNQRRMRMEDLILLALRCALLLLLALALARPAILSNASSVFGKSKVTGVIILDNSYSMGMSDGTATRFDRARQAAEQVLDSMPAGSATAVFLASDIVQPVIPEPTLDLNLVRKVIREAPLSDRATDIFPALNQALKALEGRLAVRKEIYLVTDGQASGWRQMAEIQSALEKTRSEIATQVIFVNEHEEQNLGISELRLASGLSPAKQPLRFEVKVSNYGKQTVRDTRLSLSVNGEPPGDEFTLDALAPGATKSVTLFARLRDEGFHSVSARIPADRLAADDKRTVAVRAIKEVRVLLVDGEPGGEPRDSEVFFLRHALVPVPPELVENYFVKITVLTGPELGEARLDDFDAVVLANVADVSEKTLESLASYLRRGGGLIVFPGERLNTGFYNEQLFKRFKFLPAAFGSARGQSEQEQKFVSFQEKDYEHSVVTIWNDPASGKLSSARFFKYFELKPDLADGEKRGKGEGEKERNSRSGGSPLLLSSSASASPAEDAGLPQVILKYSDGAPAVMEHTWGLGRVLLFSSTADTAWNDLPVRPAFVPLIHRLIGAIVQRQDEGLNIRVGERFTRRIGAEFLDRDATFFKPRPTEVARDLRHVDLVNGWPALQYDQTDFAGLYDVSVADPPLALKFAAQPDPRESSLEELSPAQLATLKDVASVVTWAPNLSLRGLMEKGRSGLEFWLPLVVLALMLAVTETFLGQWFSRSK